jgi:WD40 repeat protein
MNTAFARSTGKRVGACLKASFVLPLLFLGVGGQAPVVMAQSAGTFTATGNMTRGRSGHTATLLVDGRVLIAGGNADATAELYDPATGTFTATGNMTTARWDHTATLLPDGRVLIVGRSADSLVSADLYDPSTGTFTAAGNITTSTNIGLLADGRVLIAGGPVAVLYDPGMRTFTVAGDPAPMVSPTATLLPDGRVLFPAPFFNSQLYDPRTGTFSLTGPQTAYESRATLLTSGKVLVTGGNDDPGPAADAEVYDPSIGSFTRTGNMTAQRANHTSTLLPDGRVLITGGNSWSSSDNVVFYYSCCLASAELYDRRTGRFTSTGSMVWGRAGHTATLLESGKVLIAGGGGSYTAELYNPEVEVQGTPIIRIVDNDTGSLTTLAVGDSFSFQLTGAPPHSLVSVSETGWSGSVGYTDASGLFWLNGIIGSNVVGTWQQTWTIGGVLAQPAPLQFTITPKP